MGDWNSVETPPEHDGLYIWGLRNGEVVIGPRVWGIEVNLAAKTKLHKEYGTWPNAGFVPLAWRPVPEFNPADWEVNRG